jgi:SPX domain protein involved in polyphosphate accumulation|tara:strand:- start:160 stop:840 length:681 start_codon:yes stop_codon:yes gene_type:complete
MSKNNNLLKRFERKWVFDSIDHNQLFILLNRSKFLFTTQFSDRLVNSIYFDDEHYTSINQNIDGVSEKKKYRLRWYGDFKNITNPTFEIKSKKGFEVSKKNFDFPKINNLNLLDYKDIEKIELLINSHFKFKNKLFPILTTHYLRSYFLSSNKLVRSTVDRNLKSLLLYKNRNLNIIKEYNDIILEFKYDLNLDEYVRANLGNISSRFSKNSKFVNAATVTPHSLA